MHLFSGIAKVLAVERVVKPRNMNFAKVEGGGGWGGRLIGKGPFVRINTVTQNFIYP